MIIKKINYANIASRQVFHSTLHSKKTHFNSRELNGARRKYAKQLKNLAESEIQGITSLEKLGTIFGVSRGQVQQILTPISSFLQLEQTGNTNADVRAVWEKLQETELE